MRNFIRLDGITSHLAFGVHNNSLVNVLRGLRERVFAVDDGCGGLKPTPKPMKGAFGRLDGVRQRLLRTLNHCNPFTYQEFLDCYTGSKRVRYEQAVEELNISPVSRRDATLMTFVKAEKINLTKKPDPAPRVIQPRSPRYNVEVGCFIKAIEGRVYDAIGKMFEGPTVMKGYNAEQTASHILRKWNKFVKPVAVGLDASRFDQHVSRDALLWEHSIYNGVFRSRKLAKLLEWQIANRGVAYCEEAKVKYEIDGCRMSGDMNTALGNCLIMCSLVRAYLDEKQIDGELVNNGDDCVVIMESGKLSKFMDGLERWFLEMGFKMAVEVPVYEIQKIEFCQTNPINVNGTWIMVRNPIVALAKDPMCLHPNMTDIEKSYSKWAEAVGKCGLSLAGGVPIIQELYLRMLTVGEKAKRVQGFGDMASGFEFMARGMNRNYQGPSEETRYQFWLAYGITPDNQIAIEEEIRNALIEPEVSRMMTVDDIEPIVLQI